EGPMAVDHRIERAEGAVEQDQGRPAPLLLVVLAQVVRYCVGHRPPPRAPGRGVLDAAVDPLHMLGVLDDRPCTCGILADLPNLESHARVLGTVSGEETNASRRIEPSSERNLARSCPRPPSAL